MVEAAAEHRVLQREQEGGAFEGLGELLAHSSGHFRRGEDRDTGAAEEVIVCFQTAGRRDGGVRQDEVKAVELEGSDEVLGLVLMADELDGFCEFHGRREDSVDDDLGQNVGDPDGEALGASTGTAFEDVGHFLTEGEDFVGVSIDDAAEFGKDEVSALTREELLSEGFFESTNLSRDGGLGEQQGFAGSGYAALASNGSEVEKVVIVYPVHDGAPGFVFQALVGALWYCEYGR